MRQAMRSPSLRLLPEAVRHARRCVLLLIVFFMISGLQACSLHKSMVPEQGSVVPAPENFANRTGHEAGRWEGDKWWKSLHNPELDRLISQGLMNNLDITVALERLKQARAAAAQAQAARLPWIGFNLDSRRSKHPSVPEDITGNTYEFSIAASYEIDLWQKFKSKADAAEFMASAAEEDLKAAYISVAAQIADLYYMAMEQKAQLQLIDAIIRSSSRTLDLVWNRYESGIAEPVDVYQARQTLESARSRRPVYEAGFKKANHALSIMLGRVPDPGLIKTGCDLPANIAPPETGIPAELLANRPDVHAAWLRLRSFDAAVAAAVADLFPAVRIGAGIGQSQSLILGDPLVGSFWNLLLSVAQPVFEGGRRMAEVKRQKAAFREHLALYHKTVLTAFKEVEDALATFQASEKEMHHLEKLVEATQGDVRLSRERYFWGLTEYLPVLTAQTMDLEARTKLIVSRGRYISAWISLVRALGGTWPQEQIKTRLGGQ